MNKAAAEMLFVFMSLFLTASRGNCQLASVDVSVQTPTHFLESRAGLAPHLRVAQRHFCRVGWFLADRLATGQRGARLGREWEEVSGSDGCFWRGRHWSRQCRRGQSGAEADDRAAARHG